MPHSAPLDQPYGLHPLVLQWLRQQRGEPTEIQQALWPRIAAGDHVLGIAPTGSGKTLAACLVALQQLLLGHWPAGQLQVLYLSPLKALGRDVTLNLLEPLGQLQELFAKHALPTSDVKVGLRTGDTAASERQKMLKRPPQILVTTPESLQLLLISQAGRQMLQSVRQVVLDEVHALVGTKRGAMLAANLEELSLLPGLNGRARRIQRVALSATVADPERARDFAMGLSEGPPARQMAIARATNPKHIHLQLAVAPALEEEFPGNDGLPATWWQRTGAFVRQQIVEHRSTLVFGNSRRAVERMAREINGEEAETLAYSHHGSLSQELRRDVEQRLKAGQLRAVCATSSLELGIDVGAVDQVVLIGTPRSVASTLQRVGRAGHQVGAVSFGQLIPMHGRDMVRALAVLQCADRRELEPLPARTTYLDVAAQLCMAFVAASPRTEADLLALLRRAEPFGELQAEDLADVIAMLCGRFAGLRSRELQPRLDLERTGLLVARPGTRLAVAQSGGVIADRGYYRVVAKDSNALVGELDEEFVFERAEGDVIAVGSRSWQVVEIGRDAVYVAPSKQKIAVAPFWRADQDDRGPLLATTSADLLAGLEPRLHDPQLAQRLTDQFAMTHQAAEFLVNTLVLQRQMTGALPTLQRVIWEKCHDPTDSSVHIVLHAPWGGTRLRPLALALEAWLEHRTSALWTIANTDECLLVRELPGYDTAALLAELCREDVAQWVERGLQASPLVGQGFREAAGVALLLPRPRGNQRMPLWVTRERAKLLLAAVGKERDFALVRGVSQNIRDQRLDVAGLIGKLDDLQSGKLEVVFADTAAPSPLADGVQYLAVSDLMYRDDRPLAAAATQNALEETVRSAQVRPALQAELVAALRSRSLRCDPAWAPRDPGELLDAMGELAPLTAEEWQVLSLAAAEAQGVQVPDLVESLGDQLLLLESGRVATLADGPRLAELAAVPVNDKAFGQWALRCVMARGVCTWADLSTMTLRGIAELQAGLQPWLERRELLGDVQVLGSGDLWLGSPLAVERLLRQQRTATTRTVKPRPAGDLILLRAQLQGLLQRERGTQSLRSALTRLQGLPLPLAMLESDLLPARLPDYHGAWLDELVRDHGWQLLASGDRDRPAISFAAPGTLPLWLPPSGDGPRDPHLDALLADPLAFYSLESLLSRTQDSPGQCYQRLLAGFFAGQVTVADFASLRRMLALEFALPTQNSLSALRYSRSGAAATPMPGSWQRLDAPPPRDLVDAAERDAERARQLGDRHGILHPLLLDMEPPHLRFRALLPALRRLDWSGELQAGAWCEGLAGLSLASTLAARTMHQLAEQHAQTLWWCHSQDPGSPSWLPRALTSERVPNRHNSTWLVLRGAEVVAVASRGGKSLRFYVDPRDGQLSTVVELLLERVQRLPRFRFEVETIGDEGALRSPYREALEQAGLVADHRGFSRV